jgi:hypothetical protein
VEQLLSLVFGERCGSGCGLFIRYFPYIFLMEVRKITSYLSERPIPGQNLTNGYLVKQTPWRGVLEKLSFSASPKISCISQNPKIHYYVQKSPPLVQILSQINPVHALNPITLTSILLFHTHIGLPSGLLPSAVSTKPLYAIIVPPIYVTACTTHLNLLHFSL